MTLRGQVADARDIVDALPGGEMLLEHQHEVIAMLTQMRDTRRYVLSRPLSTRVIYHASLLFGSVRTQLARLSDLSLGSPNSQKS